ncbi:hypothetical protein [Mycolicibacterium palauense]|uniref:hypothetical protein n=1 Tax=Mycolicibacterium palauense TaxID=2034511 RepID=UPI000BFF051E|nr:hypothetical protein [Mycolicibacterium palauense]
MSEDARPSDDDQPKFAEVVHTTEELNELFAAKDHNWRYAGFVSVLVQRRDLANSRVRDHLFRFAKPTGERARDSREVGQFVVDAMQDYAQLIQQMEDFMFSGPFVAIMCSPHDEASADAEAVYHCAMRLMDFYDRILAFSERARGLAAPSTYADLLNNVALLSDSGIDGYHRFIDEFVQRVAEMPAIMLAANGGEVQGEPIVLTFDSPTELLETIGEQLRSLTAEV